MEIPVFMTRSIRFDTLLGNFHEFASKELRFGHEDSPNKVDIEIPDKEILFEEYL